jgi:hypothetical protein
MSVIYDLCVQKYEQGGQFAVFDFVNQNFPELFWGWCKPCESESPIESATCLVCGSKAGAL